MSLQEARNALAAEMWKCKSAYWVAVKAHKSAILAGSRSDAAESGDFLRVCGAYLNGLLFAARLLPDIDQREPDFIMENGSRVLTATDYVRDARGNKRRGRT